MKRILILALVTLAGPGMLPRALADCCQECGCSCNCCKVCRCVPDVKKVPKTTYTCECEDFCVPGPSDHCVVCDECGNKEHVYTPGCAKIYTRKKAVKHETITEVKTYKWVVVNLCPACCAQKGEAAAGAASQAQATPPAAGQQVSYQAPSGEATAAPTAEAAHESSLKSQLRRMLQPVLGRESSAP